MQKFSQFCSKHEAEVFRWPWFVFRGMLRNVNTSLVKMQENR